MTDHDQFEELAALSAGELLSEQEYLELHQHMSQCAECQKAEREFSELVGSGLPLAASSIQEFLQRTSTKPDDAVRARFLQRARREGVVFSAEVAKAEPQRENWVHSPLGGLAAVAATLLLVVGGTMLYRGASFGGSLHSQQRIKQLQEQNSILTAQLSQLNQSVATQQHEIDNLRTQLGAATKTAESLRHENEQAPSEAQRTSSQVVQFPAELANRDKQLEDARAEIQRINQLRATDEASLVTQQVKIADLSDQLRIASATLDLERQLTAAGRDIRDLLTARQLHVIDVRDTDANGNPSKAFGRVFVTEGKSLTFYAFDLNQDRPIDAKHRFEVWGAQAAHGSPAHRLGFFYEDNKAQSRWALKVSDPQLVKEVEAVFVTVEPAGGAAAPSGQPMLYTYLGQPHHP